MKRKLFRLVILACIMWILSAFISMTLFWGMFAIGILFFCFGAFFLIANKLVKKTNWWKNQYMFTCQFVSNSGYRDNIIRNYEIVNLGSNPALYAFFYESVKGQSWATGSQGQDMDFELLKYFHSYIKEGGTVLIPIMPFTALSPYIKNRKEYWGISYYSKFIKLVDYAQMQNLKDVYIIRKYLNWPLMISPRSFRYLLKDVPLNNMYLMTEQPMMHMELQQNAIDLIKAWKKEFNLRDLTDVMNPEWNKYYEEAVELNKTIVKFCLERNLKPVFVCVPMTKYLSDMFPENVTKYLIEDFILKANEYDIPFMNYTRHPDFQDSSLYINSFFLNLKGRKLFTNKVLKDLGLLQ